eukprot:9323989-Pyramimonas_sp.AAC.1
MSSKTSKLPWRSPTPRPPHASPPCATPFTVLKLVVLDLWRREAFAAFNSSALMWSSVADFGEGKDSAGLHLHKARSIEDRGHALGRKGTPTSRRRPLPDFSAMAQKICASF